MTIFLSEEDRKELVELYQTAQTTPVIAFSVANMIEGRDWSSLAWNSVREKMDKLGKKYGFDPRISPINQKTGEVQSSDQKGVS